MIFRLSDNDSWAEDFSADTPAELGRLLSATLARLHADGKIRGPRGCSLHHWINTGYVTLGVYFDPGQPHGSAQIEIRGYGHHFLRVTLDDVRPERVWAMAHNEQPPDDGLTPVDCRRGRYSHPLCPAPELQRLHTLFTNLVYIARTERRFIAHAGMDAKMHGATFLTQTDAAAREYVRAAREYKPDTDWMDWEAYVRGTVSPEDVADIVVDAVAAVSECNGHS